MTTPAQDAELAKAATRTVYFVEFHFSGGTGRFNSSNTTISWDGFDWLGLGTLGNISEIESSDSVNAKALSFTLNAAQLSWLSLAVGDVAEYRGRPAKLYMCPLDEQFRLIDTPELCWNGIMDTMAVGIEGENGQITLKCETAAYGLKRRQALRINAAQQKKKYPTDTGFDYLTDLIGKPQLWLSKKFQMQ